ncbi:MAG: peptidoglycan-binding domain-containing protein [Acidimicrobiales bacterium]
MTTDGLPLQLGDAGPAVDDLHGRLGRLGHRLRGSTFDDHTEQAVKVFQSSRLIEVDGVVGPHTWSALVEADHNLGDRLLYLKSSPMLRGDDVAELQQRLGALGFDAGRVDGIFGPETAEALEAFQRNGGLPTDGIFGPASLTALSRLGRREGGSNVAAVREHERLLRTDSARACKVMLGDLGGLGGPLDTCARRLAQAGLIVETISHPDESHHARLANDLGIDLYVGVLVDDEPRCTAAFFSTEGFESAAGRHLAGLLAASLADTDLAAPAAVGQRLPVLADALANAIMDWAAAPSDAVPD